MLKRIGLFLLTNLAVIITISIIIFVVEKFTWIQISGWANAWYISLFIFSSIVWFTWAFISLFMSKWMAKRAYNITIIEPRNVVHLSNKETVVWETVEKISRTHWIDMPEVGIYEDSEPNAFATWASKNNSLVAVSSWLLDNMNNNEIEAVIAHEMGHILNWDMVTMTLLQWILNTFVVFISRILASIIDSFLNKDEESNEPSWIYIGVSMLFELLLWILASMIAMWFSRVREYHADAASARFVWKEKMIAALMALKKLEPILVHSEDWKDNMAAFKIESKRWRWIAALFASHPSLDDRIKALENLRI